MLFIWTANVTNYLSLTKDQNTPLTSLHRSGNSFSCIDYHKIYTCAFINFRMKNISSNASVINTYPSSSSKINFPSRAEKIATCSAFGIEAFLIKTPNVHGQWEHMPFCTLAVLVCSNFISTKTGVLLCNIDFHLFSVLCYCNIVIWRKFQQRGSAIHQQNRAYPNQGLTKTLLFVSAASVFSLVPYAVVAHKIPFPVTCLYCTYILNFNSFASPIIYVSTITVSTILNYVLFKTSGCRWDKQRRRRRKKCLYCLFEYGGTVKNRTKWF